MAGGSLPSQVETFSAPKTLTLSQAIPVRVSKMNAVARAQLTFQNIYTPRASVQKHGQQMPGPDSSNG